MFSTSSRFVFLFHFDVMFFLNVSFFLTVHIDTNHRGCCVYCGRFSFAVLYKRLIGLLCCDMFDF